MTTTELLVKCQAADIIIATSGDDLEINAPQGALTLELRETLRQRKPDLLPVLWRLQEMRRLFEVAPRAVVYVRESARGGPGRCFSCGDALEHPQAFGRCTCCDVAADIYYTTVQEDEATA